MFTKPNLSEKTTQRLLIDNFKPTERDGDNTYVIFVTPQGKEIKMLATPRVWAMVRGRSGPRSTHTGFDGRSKTNFVLLLGKPETKRNGSVSHGVSTDTEVFAVHCFPANIYSPSTKVVAQEGIRDISLHIDQGTGEIDVRAMPTEIRPPHIQAVLRAIDAQEVLTPGQELVKEIYARITSIVGSDIVISVTVEETAAVSTLSSVMQNADASAE